MNVFDLSARITMDINGYLKGMDTAKAVAVSTIGFIGSAIDNFMAESINVGRGFDKSMSQVAATMGTTVDEMGNEVGSVTTAFGTFNGNLRDFAQYMGRNTAFTASQAADALNYMALAGYDVQKSMNMLPNVLNLASAGNMDLARASDMVTDTQTAFGITTLRTKQMVDEMAKAASTGNTSVEQLGDAFLVVGGLAKELNGGMVTLSDGTKAQTDGTQELEIALTAMANAGVKGSEAGTHMRNMLMKLSSPTAEGAEQMKKLGVQVFDNTGKMRSLSDIFQDLNRSMSRLTQEEKIQAIADLFNARDLSSAEALLAAVGQDWDHIGESILNAEGAAEQMAETQLDNLEGDLTKLDSAVEGFQIALSDGATPALREMTQMGTNAVLGLTESLQSLPEPMQGLVGMIGLVGGKAMEAAPQVAGLLGNLSEMATAARNAGDESGGFAGKLLSFAKSPVFLSIAAGIAIAVAAFATFQDNVQANTEAVREFKAEADLIYESTIAAADSVSEMSEESLSGANAAEKLAQAQQNLAALQEAQAQAADKAATAQAHLDGEISDGAIKTNLAADVFSGFTNGVFNQAIALQSVSERAEGYTAVVEDMTEVQERQTSAMDAAVNQVSAYTLLAEDMDAKVRMNTESLLNMMDVQSTSPAVYSEITGAIQELNQAYMDEKAVAQDTIDSIQGDMNALLEEYEAAKQVNYESLTSQFGLFQQMKVEVNQSVTDMIASLDSQIAFMDQYAANIDAAAQLGIDDGLLKRLSDGSAESAAILQSIVDDGGQHIGELNSKFSEVEKGKQTMSEKLGDIQTDFNSRMGELEGRLDQAVAHMNQADKTYQYGMADIRGLIRGISAEEGALYSKMESVAANAASIYAKVHMQKSPSKLFRQMGIYDMEGIIEGVDSKAEDVERAYEGVAERVVGAYEDMSGGYETASNARNRSIAGGNQITMNVYGSAGQNVNQLAEIVIRKLQTQINQEVAVYA